MKRSRINVSRRDKEIRKHLISYLLILPHLPHSEKSKKMFLARHLFLLPFHTIGDMFNVNASSASERVVSISHMMKEIIAYGIEKQSKKIPQYAFRLARALYFHNYY